MGTPTEAEKWQAFQARYSNRGTAGESRRRSSKGLAELEAALTEEAAKLEASLREPAEVAPPATAAAEAPPVAELPVPDKPPGGLGGPAPATEGHGLDIQLQPPEEPPVQVTLTIDSQLQDRIQAVMDEMEAHPIAAACDIAVSITEAVIYMLMTYSQVPVDHKPPPRYNTSNTDHLRREASPPGPVQHAVKTTREAPYPPQVAVAPPPAAQALPPDLAPSSASPQPLAACLATVAPLGWEPWSAAAPIPPLQHDVHAFYVDRGWVRMRATRWVGIDDPDTGQRATPEDIIWYWYPTTATIEAYASLEPSDLQAHTPAASRVPAASRPGDANGRPPHRMVTPHGPCDVIPDSWGQ